MLRERKILVALLVLLTLAQMYAVYSVLWFGWIAATPITHPELARLAAGRWELATVPIGLLWITCLVTLVRGRTRRMPQ